MPRPAEALYTPQMLGLAVELARYPLSDDLPLTGEARSASCGSTVSVALAADCDGRVERVGMQVAACAVGQAAAALFARHVRGLDAAALASTRQAVAQWLMGERAEAGWPGFEAIEAARAYPARHPAILLPWKAAEAALSKAPAPR